MHRLSRVPIVVDPSHGSSRRELVDALGKAAIAAGADGLMIEVHPSPNHAIKDGPQSITLEQFQELMPKLGVIARPVDRTLSVP